MPILNKVNFTSEQFYKLTASVMLTYVGGTSLPSLLASAINLISQMLKVVPPSCAHTSVQPSSLVGLLPSACLSSRLTSGPEKYTLRACANVSWTTERISGCRGGGAGAWDGGRAFPK